MFLRVLDLSNPSSNEVSASFWSHNRGTNFAERPLILNHGAQAIPIFIPEEGSIPAHEITPPIMMAGATRALRRPEIQNSTAHTPPKSGCRLL